MSKQYGLIKTDKTKVISRPSIFNSDSDSNDGPERPTGISVLKKKERIAQEKAVEDDPTIYQYDELYDEMQSKRKESKLARKDLDKKPKYINKLLETAERRKRENERRIERQVQKEREEEGDIFKDKESFVTSAYRQKLEEMKQLEEQEKREDYLEAIGDVKKQSDLSGFYRHLYAQQVNSSDEEKTEKEDLRNKKTQPETNEQRLTSKRKYRKRETSLSDDENTPSEQKPKLEHLPSNIDADSDFSIDSESDSDVSPKKLDNSEETIATDTSKQPETIKSEVGTVETTVETAQTSLTNQTKQKEDLVQESTPEEPKKPKIDIWKKRTVGEVFDDALKRFYERKSAKLQLVN